MPVSLARSITSNEARLGEMLVELSVDKRSDGVPVGLGIREEGLGEFIWSTFGVDLDERAVSCVLLLVEGSIFGGRGGLPLVDDLLACGGLGQYFRLTVYGTTTYEL
jgi:hypothetical protein